MMDRQIKTKMTRDSSSSSSDRTSSVNVDSRNRPRTRSRNQIKSPNSDTDGPSIRNVNKDPNQKIKKSEEENKLCGPVYERPDTRFYKIHKTPSLENQKLRPAKQLTKSQPAGEPILISDIGKPQTCCGVSEPNDCSQQSEAKVDDEADAKRFFIRRKRLRSELDNDGLWNGLPTMLRYPKNSQRSNIITINLQHGSSSMVYSSLNESRQTRPAIEVKPTRRCATTRSDSESSDEDSQGFSPHLCSETQPFHVCLVGESPGKQCVSNDLQYSLLNVSPGFSLKDKTSMHPGNKPGPVDKNKLAMDERPEYIEYKVKIEDGYCLKPHEDKLNAKTKTSSGNTKVILERKNVFREIFGPCISSNTDKPMTNEEHVEMSSKFSCQTQPIINKLQDEQRCTVKKAEISEVLVNSTFEDLELSSAKSTDTADLSNVPTCISKIEKGVLCNEKLLITDDTSLLNANIDSKIDRLEGEDSKSSQQVNPVSVFQDVVITAPHEANDGTTLSSCQPCRMNCNCRIIDTSSSNSSSQCTKKQKRNGSDTCIQLKETVKGTKTTMSGSDQDRFIFSGTERTADIPSRIQTSLVVQDDSSPGSFALYSSQEECFSTENEHSNTNFSDACTQESNMTEESTYTPTQKSSDWVVTTINRSFSAGRNIAECSMSCIPESPYSSCDRTMSIVSSISASRCTSMDDSSSSDYPMNSADTTQYSNFIVEVRDKAASNHIPNDSDTKDNGLSTHQSDYVNHLGKMSGALNSHDLNTEFIETFFQTPESGEYNSTDTDRLFINLSSKSPAPYVHELSASEKESDTLECSELKRSSRIKRKANVVFDCSATSLVYHENSNQTTKSGNSCSSTNSDGYDNTNVSSEEPQSILDKSGFQEIKMTKDSLKEKKKLIINKNLRKSKTEKISKTKQSKEVKAEEVSATKLKQKRTQTKNTEKKPPKKNQIKVKKMPKIKVKNTDTKLQTTEDVNISESCRTTCNSNTLSPKAVELKSTESSATNVPDQLMIKKEVLTPEKEEKGLPTQPPDIITTPTRPPSSAGFTSNAERRPDHCNESLSSESLSEHAKTLWLSENRRSFKQSFSSLSAEKLEETLETHWTMVSPKVKLRYFTRAKYALLDEDKHSMKRHRLFTDKSQQHDEPMPGGAALRRTTQPSRPVSDIDRFLRLKPLRQREIIQKWLKFYQKLLPRRDYSRFLADFEQTLNRNRLSACEDSANNLPKGTDMEFFHRKILFECMKRIKPKVINNCNEKYQMKMDDLQHQYSNVIWQLIHEDGSKLISGCRSSRLEQTLKDLVDLEKYGYIDVKGHPRKTSSYTCILGDIQSTGSSDVNNQLLLSDLPGLVNEDLSSQILHNIQELPSLELKDIQEFLGVVDEPSRATSRGDACSGASSADNFNDSTSCDIETRIRSLLHKEAIDAFIRSNESSTRSCCDLDSPSCILSTWIAADYDVLTHICSEQQNDESL